MTKKEIISKLDSDAAKKAIARQLGTRSFDFALKSNGSFNIDLTQVNNKALNFILGDSKKSSLVSNDVEVNEDSYKASILLKGPFEANVGELTCVNNKWECSVTNRRAEKKTEVKKPRQRKSSIKPPITFSASSVSAPMSASSK